MSGQAKEVEARIFFRTEAGPRSDGQYKFEAAEFDRLKAELVASTSPGVGRAKSGAYNCQVMRDNSTSYRDTVLILKFDEVLYIG
jgi:hypothetical protein